MLTTKCIQTLIATTDGRADVIVVDDASPHLKLAEDIRVGMANVGGDYLRNHVNEGFSRTVNAGLGVALAEGRDAVLVNADVQFFEEGWLDALLATEAYIAGGLLLFPSGLVQHAGIYYSLLHREFDHIYRNAPGDLPEARRPRECPVTGALQLIRHESLALVGTYDVGYRMGYEDVDYCMRVIDAGQRCEYAPGARAVHHEKAFRAPGGAAASKQIERWARESKDRLHWRWAGRSFQDYFPTMLAPGEGWRDDG